MTLHGPTFLVRGHVITRPTWYGALYSVADRMLHRLLLVPCRTFARDNVATSSQTACTQQFRREETNTCASTNHAVTMTAATSIMERRAVRTTTQDCIHTFWQGFVRYLSPLAHSMLFSQSSSRQSPSGIRRQGKCWIVHAEESLDQSHSEFAAPAQDLSGRGDLHFHRTLRKAPNGVLHVVKWRL